MTDTILVHGHDLVEEVIGQWSFAELTFVALTGGKRPTPGQARMIDALLTTFVDHGVTPSSIATRLTFLGAPEAMQAAIAAGLCGAGDRYLGTMQSAGEMLRDAVGGATDSPDVSALARQVIDQYRSSRRAIPGVGHPEHKTGDPRTPRLAELARETNCDGVHMDLMLAIGDQLSSDGRLLPVNAAGLSGAIVLDMGLPPEAGRGLAIVSRAAGLAGVVLAEIRQPSAQHIWDQLRVSAGRQE